MTITEIVKGGELHDVDDACVVCLNWELTDEILFE